MRNSFWLQPQLEISRPQEFSWSTARGAICARASKSWQGRSLRLPTLLAGTGVGLAACATPFPSAPSPATRSPKSESTQVPQTVPLGQHAFSAHPVCIFVLKCCLLELVCCFIVAYQILTRTLTGAAQRPREARATRKVNNLCPTPCATSP